ncbi:MAG TPA: S9 family peptidase, partial [Bacteroidetes bacterium]|nr:S9 family peptidase [Bacteroidota bacterium]HEX05626.1 S9 family peptidase [Bacteroidota bacterium]
MGSRTPVNILILALMLGIGVSCSRQQTVDLIPLEILFGNPTQIQARIAHDGSNISYLAPYEGVLNIWLKGKDGDRDHRLTNDKGMGIRYHMWMFDNEHILYIQDKDGDENWGVHVVNVNTGEERLLTPTDDEVDHSVRAELYATDEDEPTIALIGLNKRDERILDVYRLDVVTGDLQLIEEGTESSYKWVIDNDLNVRGYMHSNSDGGSSLFLRDGNEGPFEEAIVWKSEDEMASGPVWFKEDNRILYLLDSRGRNSAALYAYDTLIGEQELLAEDSMYDVTYLMMHPVTKEAQAALVMRERSEWIPLDDDIKEDLRRLSDNARGEIWITARTMDDKQWIVYYGADNASGVYYLYYREENRFEKLFDTHPELADLPLVTMQPISFTASDGMELHGYLTLPSNAEKPVPLVLTVHGGPYARDHWGFDADAQWLANRGYACLQVNFRGSTGYGKEYLNAGDREWGGRMQDDLTDAVAWAIDQGIADPERVAIFGASYGGYAALSGAAFTPDLYCCAISLVGPSNLVTFLSSIPPYWASFQKAFDIRTGRLPRYETGEMAGLPKAEADWTEQDKADIEFLRSRSPLYSVDNIRIPMLI